MQLVTNKVVAGHKKAGSVQLEVAAMAGRNVHLLQQQEREQIDESALILLLG